MEEGVLMIHRDTFLPNYGCSSAGRAVVSKTEGREFDSYHPCKVLKQ